MARAVRGETRTNAWRAAYDRAHGQHHRHASPTVVELRELAHEAGVGTVSPPAPMRLDDVSRLLAENRSRMARLRTRLATAD